MDTPFSLEESRRQWEAMKAQEAMDAQRAAQEQAAAQAAFNAQPTQDYQAQVLTAMKSPQDIAAEAAMANAQGTPAPSMMTQPVPQAAPMVGPQPGLPPEQLQALKENNPAAYQAMTGEAPAMAGPVVRDLRTATPPPPVRRPMGGGGGGGPAPSPWMDTLMPQARALHNESYGGMKEAIGMRQALGERVAAEDTAMAGKNEELLDEAAQRYASQKEAQAQQARLVEEKYANAVDAMDHVELDNDRWWNKKSTGEKIGTTIGALLAGLGSGLSRDQSSNAGVSLLQNQMAADLEQQKDAYHRKGAKAAGLQSLYAQMMRRFGDEDQAFNAAMALGTRKLGAQVQKLAAARGTDEAAARAKEMLAALQGQEVQFISQSFKARPMGGGAPKDKLLEEIRKKRALAGVDIETEALKKSLGLGEYGKPDKGHAAAVGDISKKLNEADIPAALEQINRAREKISTNDEGTNFASKALFRGDIPGLPATLQRAAYGAFHGQEAVDREGEYSGVKSAARKVLTGLGVSIPEVNENEARMEGSGTKADRLAAIDRLEADIKTREASIAASNPEAYAEYVANVRAAKGLAPSAKVNK